MITFITTKQHNILPELEMIEIRDTFSPEDVSFISSLDVVGLDTETTGLEPYTEHILLFIIGTEERQYVIDTSSIDILPILKLLDSTKIVIGANIKFDYKFVKIKYGIALQRMFDIMIAEQRLVQGTELPCNLEAIRERRLGIVGGMNKDIREEFIGVNPTTFLFSNKHIVYAANDIKDLFKIREKQKERIKLLGQEFLIYGIEFPLIPILADAELQGVAMNEDKWKEIIKENEEKQFEFSCKLDEEVRRLRANLPENEQLNLIGGNWDRNRNKTIIHEQGNLFDDFDTIEVVKPKKKKTKTKLKSAYTNFGSPDVIVKLFGRFKQPLPTKQAIYVVPSFIKTKTGEKIDKSLYNFTTGEGVIEQYLIEYPDTPIRDFVKLLIDFRYHTTMLNSFGAKFLTKFKNKVTGKFHTIYRQATALNGRLQSGDVKNGWFNSQNIPAKKEYRECFIADEGYSMVTTDLSGAEAVIMIDKARDEAFYKIAIVNDDAHSPLGQAVWRNIGKHRVDNKIYRNNHDKTPHELATIIITKKENKDVRTLFKNTTFASIYGAYPKKYSKMLNISVDEAKIGLNTMKSMIPKTFKLVEGFAKSAISDGYLILNYRTNSRIWYKEVLEAKRNKSELEFKVASDIESSARNAPISGTQADMIKEMIVEIQKDIDKNGWDAKLIFQVHDELVYMINDNLLDIFPKYKKEKMCEVANQYLSFIKMSAEQEVLKYWTK